MSNFWPMRRSCISRAISAGQKHLGALAFEGHREAAEMLGRIDRLIASIDKHSLRRLISEPYMTGKRQLFRIGYHVFFTDTG